MSFEMILYGNKTFLTCAKFIYHVILLKCYARLIHDTSKVVNALYLCSAYSSYGGLLVDYGRISINQEKHQFKSWSFIGGDATPGLGCLSARRDVRSVKGLEGPLGTSTVRWSRVWFPLLPTVVQEALDEQVPPKGIYCGYLLSMLFAPWPPLPGGWAGLSEQCLSQGWAEIVTDRCDIENGDPVTDGLV